MVESRSSLINTLAAIESRTIDQLSIDLLSNEASFSSSHLQRLFKITTGQPLMDYVRGRKLAHSLTELLSTNYRIIDIANRYGFQYEQSYIRAFHREFGCTPGQARKNKSILPIRERIDPQMLQVCGEGFLYGPEIVMVPSLHIVGKPHIFEHFDNCKDALVPNKLAKEFFYQERHRISNVVNSNVYIGCVSFPADATYAEMDSFFANQSRYVPLDNYFLEWLDISLYNGVHCKMEWLHPVKDTLP